MFDAKSILEKMISGAGQRPNANGTGTGTGTGGLDDLLGQLGKMIPQGSNARGGQGAPGHADTQGTTGLDDLIRQLGGSGRAGAAGGGLMGGLGEILGRIQEQASKSEGAQTPAGRMAPGNSGATGAGPLMDILGQVFAQATSGAREGAGKVGAATGANEALGRMTGGKSLDEIVAQIKDLVANNQFGAGAATGGLGAVILGTQTGRSLATNAAKLGALALIGGLAYKAYTNYQSGRPLISSADQISAAPDGSGFEPDAMTNAAAILYIRAMIAAAAADGRVDASEMDNIVGNLKQAGFDSAAEEFIAGELNAPASAHDIAQSTIGAEQALQVYTAARLAVTLDSPAEKVFLQELATKLGIAPELAAHVEATARGQAA